MTADEAIALRKLWKGYTFGRLIGPKVTTILADDDWLTYVQAMTASVPAGQSIVWPSEEEARWAWPEGVLVIFPRTVTLGHTIISQDVHGYLEQVDPHIEEQEMRAMLFGPTQLIPTVDEKRNPLGEMSAVPFLFIGEDPTDIVTAHWMPGFAMTVNKIGDSVVGTISESSRFSVSLITAIGHRLTTTGPPVTASRSERRRIERELPEGLHVLRLTSGVSAPTERREGGVAWSHRWMVRGHWRLQPCGPRRSQRRLIWIDPFIKGPSDKPLDVRPTVWQTGHP